MMKGFGWVILLLTATGAQAQSLKPSYLVDGLQIARLSDAAKVPMEGAPFSDGELEAVRACTAKFDGLTRQYAEVGYVLQCLAASGHRDLVPIWAAGHPTEGPVQTADIVAGSVLISVAFPADATPAAVYANEAAITALAQTCKNDAMVKNGFFSAVGTHAAPVMALKGINDAITEVAQSIESCLHNHNHRDATVQIVSPYMDNPRLR